LSGRSSVIADQATQLGSLVDQVLLFSATAKSSQLHILDEVRVDEIVDGTIQSTMVLWQGAGFIIERQIQPNLPPLLGDPTLLSQCLQNLISNAVKFSPVNRWVRISAKMNDFANEIQIKVQDHGIGISSSDL
jgi:signal transduction histidine kinase